MPAPQAASLQQSYPWTKQPLITNAPMGGLISPELVAEVTRAGGLGFLGAGYELTSCAERLTRTRALLSTQTTPPLAADSPLPVGLGVLCFTISLDAFAALVRTHRPVAVWLFAAHADGDYAAWAAGVRAACGARIWIQTNSVAGAVALARTAAPDVLVLQGADAGGHGPASGAGIVSLVPETADALAAAGFGHIPLVAAGGIVDGRGTAAAVALGAAGVTLGTRFLACDEVAMADRGYQRALLAARDGGQATARSKVFDDVLSPNGSIWPAAYDGRGLRNQLTRDEESGVSVEENRRLFNQDRGFKDSMADSRAVAWSGTGVGLVNTIEPAAAIITNAREGALKLLGGSG